MGQIRKKEVRILDSEGHEPVSYCPHCLKYGVYRILRERIYMPEEVTNPHERENWRQCHDCGTIIPIYETKKESKLQDFIQISNNPFDPGQTVTGIGNKKHQNRYQKEREKVLERIDNEKDEEIKSALKKGNIVEIIEDTMYH